MAQTETRPGFRLPWTRRPSRTGITCGASDPTAKETETPKMIDAMAPSSIAASTPASSAVPQTVGGGR